MIKTLQFEGYRLLDDFTAFFDKLTVVIGANATGKSTLIDSLRLISESAQFPVTQTVVFHGGMPVILSASSGKKYINWKLTFNKTDLPPFFSEMPFRDEDYTYEVQIEADPYGQAQPVYEILRTSEPRLGYTEPFRLLECNRGRSFVFNPKVKKLIDFDQVKDDSQEKKGNHNDEAMKTPGAYLEGKYLLLAKMLFKNEYPDAAAIRTLISNFAFYPGFEVGKSSSLRTKPSEIKPFTMLFPSGENLGTVLHDIFTRYEYKNAADDIMEFLKSAYPYVESLNTETALGNPPSVLVRVREEKMQRSMELWDLSDGFLRFLCLAAALLNPLPPSFMALDEPEAGLHPRLLPIVADMIKTASERTQVLVTTHSPDLLNSFDLDHLAVMAREGSKIAWNRPSSRASLRQMLESVQGETLGDLHRSGELESLS